MRFRAIFLTAVTAVVALALVIAFGPTLEGQEGRGKMALLAPIELDGEAPATFKANFETTKGSFVVQVNRVWAPIGADRFHTLVSKGYYDGNPFFRVTDILVQWGINGDPEVAKHWIGAKIQDDPSRVMANRRGTVAFLQANFRRTQTLINMTDNPVLDRQLAPVGEVIEGMDVLERLYPVEIAPAGTGPNFTELFRDGTPFLEKEHPMLDYIKMATIVP